MPLSAVRDEAVRLLRRPAVVLPAVAGIGVFAFFSFRAPERPKIPPTALLATQFPTVTPGASQTLGPPPSPRPPTATPTPDRGAPGRDALRKEHLATIAAGLKAYVAGHGSSPNSGGNVQSLCTYPNIDAGCALQDYVDSALLRDPLGPYLYVSNGSSWTLFAELENAETGVGCTDPLAKGLPHPDRTYCLTGTIP